MGTPRVPRSHIRFLERQTKAGRPIAVIRRNYRAFQLRKLRNLPHYNTSTTSRSICVTHTIITHSFHDRGEAYYQQLQ
eukprot:COSAG05_NODE_254_length_12842_cov_140.995292_8_plen_78_part_00